MNTFTRFTPSHITTLAKHEIFVFGSNIHGIHAGGAARQAMKWGAVMRKGVGLQGQTYAIPTMFGSVSEIKPYVEDFIGFAQQHPDSRFLVTEIGCGIAGHTPETIGPLFEKVVINDIQNIWLPERFVEVLEVRNISQDLPVPDQTKEEAEDVEKMELPCTNIEEHPLFRKGVEILEVVHQITDLIPAHKSHLNTIKRIMLEDARVLTTKVAGAEGGDLYAIRMESATLIRKAALNLMVQNHSLEMFGFEHTEYFEILHRLIEEYRLIFIDWVARFDKWNYVLDEWGLFNPPGIEPFDVR